MPVETITHIATINGVSTLIDLQDEYGGISTIVGIKVPTAEEEAAAKASGSGSALMGLGQLIKITVAGTVNGLPSTKTNKRLTTEIYCVPEKVAAAIAGLKKKEIKGSTATGGAGTAVKFIIRKAYFKRRARFF